MQDDSFPGWGLRSIALSDQALFQRFLSHLRRPLSDYTFSQIYTWRNSLRLLWRLIDDHLCVFANGAGDLTLLLPPIAAGSDQTASVMAGVAGMTTPVTAGVMHHAFELMDDYNADHAAPDRSRVEYVSQELLDALETRGMAVTPLGHDYVYDTQRMIDLAGGDLKSKRQERGRFMRDQTYRCETYSSARHLNECLQLLGGWKDRQDASHATENAMQSTKREKESLATELTLQHAEELGIAGMVVYVGERLSGFTFGEPLGADQASIVVEKTDLAIKGLAQFIFSEFCKTAWSDRARINVGDDWGIETLAWTKASYRPIELMPKFVLKKQAVQQVTSGFDRGVRVRKAEVSDLDAIEKLETACFDAYRMTRQQLRTFQHNPRAILVFAEVGGELAGEVGIATAGHIGGEIVGEGVALLRRQKTGIGARLYSLAVRDDQRGRGIGERLLCDMIAQCVAHGVRRIHLQVDRANAAAIRLYERHDFQQAETLPDYYGTGRDGIHMVCDIARASNASNRPALKPAA